MDQTPILLLTRFSWPHPIWRDRSKAEFQAWLATRILLLRHYPVRSIRNAYIKPNMWLILAQDHEPDFNVGLEATAEAAGVPFTVLRYSGKDIQRTVSDYLIESSFVRSERICTLRLDSDDLVGADYFARIQTVLAKEQNEARDLGISFPGGCTYDASLNQFYYSCYPDNPFIGLVENLDPNIGITTVFRKMHTELLQTLPRTLYLRSDQPIWCSVVHGGNVANESLLKSNPTPLSHRNELLRRFGASAL